MSTTYAFHGTNSTASTAPMGAYKLGLKTNYGEIKPANGQGAGDPGTVFLRDSSVVTGGDEVVRFVARPQKGISSFVPKTIYPGAIKDTVLITGELHTYVRETRDDGTIIDHPFKFVGTVLTDITAPWTDVPVGGKSLLQQGFERGISIFRTDAGGERWADLMKSVLVPKAD